MTNKPDYIERFMNQGSEATSANPEKAYLTLKVPITLDAKNLSKLRSVSSAVAFAWNRLTEHQENNGWADSYFEIKKLLPEIKKATPWLKDASSQVLQEVAKSHSGATKSWRTKRAKTSKVTGAPIREAKANPPGYKASRIFQSHKYPQRGVSFSIAGAELKLSYGSKPSDWIVTSLPQSVPPESVKAVTVTYDPELQQHFASLETEFVLAKEQTQWHVLAIDPGCKTALTCLRSDGTVWEYDINNLRDLNMKIYKKIDTLMTGRDNLPCAKQLAAFRKDRKAASRFVGPKPEGTLALEYPKLSREYRRYEAKITKLFASIRNRSKQYLHTLAKRIIKDHPLVAEFFVGDWAKQETVADTPFKAVNELINRAVQNNNPLGTLIEYLKYKAPLKGKQVVKFDERGTTKTCSHCDHVGGKLPPSQRTFTCRKCGFIAPRDVNATLNQLKFVSYGVWHTLKAIPALSIVRTTLLLLSCEKSFRSKSGVILNYQDARCL